MYQVTLTQYDLTCGAMVGVLRTIYAIFKGLNHAYGADPRDTWKMAIEGALGELAVARYYGIPWRPKIGQPTPGDVGGYEVRTVSIMNHRLILHPEDPDEAPAIHVVGLLGNYRLVGWVYCKQGKNDDYWEDPQGTERWAYFVPNKILQPMQTLPEAR